MITSISISGRNIHLRRTVTLQLTNDKNEIAFARCSGALSRRLYNGKNIDKKLKKIKLTTIGELTIAHY